MTVGEMIAQLQKFAPDARVVVAGYEGGFADVTKLASQPLRLNMNDSWFYGPHEECDEKEADEIAVLIVRGRDISN